MRFWITTHWAPTEDNENIIPSGVWVPDGRELAGKELRKNDYVLIYEASGGPDVLRKMEGGKYERIGRRHGRKGVIAITQALDRVRPVGDDDPERYVGRKPIWWRWYADTELVSRNGFVSPNELKGVLGYSPNYTMRGFGDCQSGLKEITERQYNELVRLFRSRGKSTFDKKIIPNKRHRARPGHLSHPESEDHRHLKEYVASNPAAALKERGLKTLAVEFPFDSGDRADIVLEDHAGRVIGLEIEVAVNPADVTGILQAIKYRHMLAFVKRRTFEETRSFLVAYSITNKLQEVCKIYSVECFIVPREDVRKWKTSNCRNA